MLLRIRRACSSSALRKGAAGVSAARLKVSPRCPPLPTRRRRSARRFIDNISDLGSVEAEVPVVRIDVGNFVFGQLARLVGGLGLNFENVRLGCLALDRDGERLRLRVCFVAAASSEIEWSASSAAELRSATELNKLGWSDMSVPFFGAATPEARNSERPLPRPDQAAGVFVSSGGDEGGDGPREPATNRAGSRLFQATSAVSSLA